MATSTVPAVGSPAEFDQSLFEQPSEQTRLYLHLGGERATRMIAQPHMHHLGADALNAIASDVINTHTGSRGTTAAVVGLTDETGGRIDGTAAGDDFEPGGPR